MDITNEQLIQWNNNKLKNPITNRKIKENGPMYKKILKKYNMYLLNNNNNINEINNININVDPYLDFRKNKIDPLLQEKLPLLCDYNDKDLFIFKYKWNPYSGEREGVDSNGPLYFDPDTLIHYFYVNRLNNLWIKNDNNFQGYYGDGVGNGPGFNIQGRGDHRNWYLFRLPIIDCYLNKDHCGQSVTMGPILNDIEIKEIYRKAKRYKNNYFNLYNKRRPNLITMKNLYELAINKNPMKLNENIIQDYIQDSYRINTDNIYKLSRL